MDNCFYIDNSAAKAIDWQNLLQDIANQRVFKPYIKSMDYYVVFKEIIYSMLAGREITLLDSDFSDQEILVLTGVNAADKIEEPAKGIKLNSKEELLNKLQLCGDSWGVTIYTSGTTGQPKKITHSFKSITRFVRVSPTHSASVWGFAYNPTHMAGLQVFFQALLNGCSIVRLFMLDKKEIFEQISRCNITNISATPTFYRLLLPCDTQYPSVVRLTSGGERFDAKISEQLLQIFPNAKINNIYASTEIGTLFAASGDVFTIKSEIEHLVKIEHNELYIHRSLMGKGQYDENDQWYNTCDMVDIFGENPTSFRIVSRTSSMINVGGYKVNPMEVEQIIREYPKVQDVRVIGKQNAILGHIIIAEVVASSFEITENEIRLYLQNKLQEYKIPRMIKFVSELKVTRTGKLQR